MLATAIVLFLAAAAGGLFMAVRIFSGALPPAPVAVIHGAAAAIALVLTFMVALAPGALKPVQYGAGILFLAALGGFFLASFHLRKKLHPKGVVVLHALIAVTGVGFLASTFL